MAARIAVLLRGRPLKALDTVLRARLGDRIDDRLVLQRWEPRDLPPPGAQWRVVRYARIDEVPNTVIDDPWTPARSWFEDRFAEGAALWAALQDERPASLVWIVRAGSLPGWYRSIGVDDAVIYSVVTAEPYRGLGAAPAAVRTLLAAEHSRGGDIWVDCKVWNKAALASFAKVGFVAVETVSPTAWQAFQR